MFYVIPDTLLKVLLNTNKTGHHVVRYMVASFIGVECHFQQYVSYSVDHGGQLFYWCFTTLSTKCQL
jgi:hypothetical protein